MKTFEVVLTHQSRTEPDSLPVTQTITVDAHSPSEAERMAWEGFYAAVGPVEAMAWHVGYPYRIVTQGDAHE